LFERAQSLAQTHSPAERRDADIARIMEMQNIHMGRVGGAKAWQAARDRAAKSLPFAL
jgi:hypothetical protein